MRRLRACALSLLAASCGALASSAPPTRSGGEILQRFHAGLADSGCARASARWRLHYAAAADRLADRDATALAVFGYVLDEILGNATDLPITEHATDT